MIYRGAELHNVAELLEGGLADVLGAEARKLLAETAVPPWEASRGAADEGLWLTRIPDAVRRGLHPRGQIGALSGSGAELRFNLRGSSAILKLKALQKPAIVEVRQGPFIVDWHVVQTEPTVIRVALPERQAMLEEVTAEQPPAFAAALTRVLLPWRPPVKLLGLEGDLEPPLPGQSPRERYLAYGSSITHGSMSVRPGGTYAQRCAERLGVDLINLGLGGGAKLEPELGAWIAGRHDWDFASLELGINLIEYVDCGEFERLVDAFVGAIARGRPEAPLFCIDLFPCRQERLDPQKVGRFRSIVAEEVASLRPGRPGQATHLAGPSLLEGFSGLSADLLHPSPLGMEQIGERLAARIRERLAR